MAGARDPPQSGPYVSNVLALMDEDPDFTYAMSSAQQYAWLEEEHPDLFARMKRRIEEGRFIPVGGMWVESDNMILPANHWCGRSRSAADISRSISRHAAWHLATGQFRLHRLLAADRPSCRIRLVPHAEDSWNDTTKFPHHSFMWEGIDGTRILTHFPPSDTYCSWMSMHELMYSQRNFLDKDLSRNAILLYASAMAVAVPPVR